MDRRGLKDRTPNSIPPRWLQCPRKSNSLISGKFLAFKTPLSSQYDDQVPEESRFPPSMLLASMSSYKVKLGLWIDLSFTSRFYDKDDVDSTGVKYVKLQCRGHGSCPTEEQTKTFIQICTQFIAKNAEEVIGVHCTHGFNRSGFLIVSYLVENQSWSIEAALNAFSQARPPGIYKEDYLKELFVRYGDIEDAPPPPPLPDWCNEFDDSVDDDGIDSHEQTPRRRKEYIKKNPTFMDGIEGVETITKQPKLLQIQRKCQSMCNWKNVGFPGSQPVSMDIKNLRLLHEKPYKVSWKADGTRYLMLIDGKDEVYFIDRDNCVFQVKNLRFPRRKIPDEHVANTLLDGEMVIDRVSGQPVPRYLVYDIIKFEGQDVGNADFDRRMLCINKEIVGPRGQAVQDGRLDRSVEPFGVRAKQFYDIPYTKELLSEKFTKQLSHEIDGLIFQPAIDAYLPGRCLEVLKWKPPSLNSVDFKLGICKEQRTGMMPEMKGFLYVGKLETPFAEIKLTKELKKLDKKIIECKYEAMQWKYMRERTDKSFPNSYDTAIVPDFKKMAIRPEFKMAPWHFNLKPLNKVPGFLVQRLQVEVPRSQPQFEGVCNSISHPVTKEKLTEFIDAYSWKPMNKRPHDGTNEPVFKKPL